MSELLQHIWPDNAIEILVRLVLAVILGGLIGLERAGTNHDAGLRTHVLVCLGSAIVMVVSENIFLDGYTADATRIGAQVVSGIGFLGAGCILINGNRIRGLTTAAGLWATASVGLGIGMGYYFVSIVSTLLILMAMAFLSPLSTVLQKKEKRHNFNVTILIKNKSSVKGINDYLYNHGYKVTIFHLDEQENAINITVADEYEYEINRLVCGLMELDGIKKVEINQ